jgi:hypothetical protein
MRKKAQIRDMTYKSDPVVTIAQVKEFGVDSMFKMPAGRLTQPDSLSPKS